MAGNDWRWWCAIQMAILGLACTLQQAVVAEEKSHIEHKVEISQQDVGLEKVWSISENDDRQIIGTVDDIVIYGDGSILVLDHQLNVLHVIDKDGVPQGTLGGEGEGPGEIYRPASICRIDEQKIGILEFFPARLVVIDRDNLPYANVEFDLSPEFDSGMNMIFKAHYVRDKIVVGGSNTKPMKKARQKTIFIGICDQTGHMENILFRKEIEFDHHRMIIRESELESSCLVYDVDDDGHIYHAPLWDKYEICIYNLDGERERHICADVPSIIRTDDVIGNLQESLINTYSGMAEQLELDVEDSERMINRITCAADGNIWISRGGQPKLHKEGIHSIDVISVDKNRLVQTNLHSSIDISAGIVYPTDNNRVLFMPFLQEDDEGSAEDEGQRSILIMFERSNS